MIKKYSVLAFISLAFLFPLTLSAIVDLEITSKEAEYVGNELVLTGEVVLEHPEGQILAERAILKDKKSGKFSKLCLFEKVELKHPGSSSHLLCAYGEIDLDKMEGSFFGDQISKVKLKAPAQNLLLESDRLDLSLLKKGDKTFFQSAVASGHISGVYELMNIEAQEAYFAKEQGVLILKGKEESCRIVKPTGEMVIASSILFKIHEDIIEAKEPRGQICLNGKDKLHFKADEIQVTSKGAHILLRNEVVVEDKQGAKILASKFLSLHKNAEGDLEEVQAEGDIQFYSDDGSIPRCIKTVGNLDISFKRSLATLIAVEGSSVLYTDRVGRIEAKRADAYLAKEEDTFVLKKLITTGDVHIENLDSKTPKENAQIEQYAVGDQLEYFPQEEKFILKASSGRRVLFLDKVNHREVSAKEIVATLRGSSQGCRIQGVGDVKMSLSQGELTTLKGAFNVR